jgi:hypothetical protein
MRSAQPCVSEQPCMQGKGVTACLAAWVLLLLLHHAMAPQTAAAGGVMLVFCGRSHAGSLTATVLSRLLFSHRHTTAYVGASWILSICVLHCAQCRKCAQHMCAAGSWQLGHGRLISLQVSIPGLLANGVWLHIGLHFE